MSRFKAVVQTAVAWHVLCFFGKGQTHSAMKPLPQTYPGTGGLSRGFTLSEVVIALAILGIIVEGVILGYVHSAQRAEWNAHSLAAQSLASQAVEQARAAQWDPPSTDDLPPCSYTQTNTLDIPITGAPEYATNFVTISTVTSNPPLRMIRADCVWFMTRRLFTNTVITFRARDQ